MRRWKNEIVVQLLLLLGCENMERREKRPPGRDGEGRAGLPINRTYSHSPDAHPDCRADCCNAISTMAQQLSCNAAALAAVVGFASRAADEAHQQL